MNSDVMHIFRIYDTSFIKEKAPKTWAYLEFSLTQKDL